MRESITHSYNALNPQVLNAYLKSTAFLYFFMLVTRVGPSLVHLCRYNICSVTLKLISGTSLDLKDYSLLAFE